MPPTRTDATSLRNDISDRCLLAFAQARTCSSPLQIGVNTTHYPRTCCSVPAHLISACIPVDQEIYQMGMDYEVVNENKRLWTCVGTGRLWVVVSANARSIVGGLMTQYEEIK